jgi:hypothetical protein
MALAIGARRAGSNLIAGKLLTAIRARAVAFAEAPLQVKASGRWLPRTRGGAQLSTGRDNPLRRRAKDGKSPAMTGDRTEAAVQRIEAALARIAQAADRPRGAAPSAPPSVSALVERHESLRETVAQALGDLDALLAELEQ